MNLFSRREFITALGAAGITASAFAISPGDGSSHSTDLFAHGVASGDPLQDRVILWTKLSPHSFNDILQGRWVVTYDSQLKRRCMSGDFITDFSRDFTVKIDAIGLEAGRTYYYYFESGNVRSAVGRTKTLPIKSPKSLRMAFASCSNYSFGYFNVYRHIAQRHDLDFVVHLGDYIYEQALGEYADPSLSGVRDPLPSTDIVTLTQYRQRHAQYKTDPDLQEVHRQHPFICVWDDHEFADDAYRDGAANHHPELGQGSWEVRKRNAIRAYYEYMPIRERSVDDDRIYRHFRIGSLADLIVLDTRVHGRDRQAPMRDDEESLRVDHPVLNDPNRSMLGLDQEQWLANTLWDSKTRDTTWRLIGQQVMMAQLSNDFGRSITSPDQWDGYAPTRARLLNHLADNRIDNVAIMSGDIHSSWCNDLSVDPWSERYNPSTGSASLAVEFVTPAVTSPPPHSDAAAGMTEVRKQQSVSPHMKYIELCHRGYGLLDVNKERVQGEIYHVDTVASSLARQSFATAFVSEAGSNYLQSTWSPSKSGVVAEPAP